MENKISELRGIKKVSQEDCALGIGISRTALSAIENGGTPSARTMLSIARYFGKSVEDIFFDTSVIQKQQSDLKAVK